MSSIDSHIDIKILDRVKSAYNLTTDAELAQFLGVRPSAIANWKTRDSINLELVISKCEDLNQNWLLFCEGPVWRRDLFVTQAEDNQQKYMIENRDFEPIPYWQGFQESEYADLTLTAYKKSKVAFSRDWIRYKLHMNWRDLFCYQMDGTSMEPMFMNGDDLVININRKVPREGPAYLVEISDQPLIKLITPLGENVLKLYTMNPRYEPFEINKDTGNFRLIGEVVWHANVSEYL